MMKQIFSLISRRYSPDTAQYRAAVGRLAGAAGIVCNLLLSAVKLTAGLLTGSVAIVGDGINNLTDSASSLVTLLGFRMAQRPADREHPFGHGRYEYLSGLAVAALVLLAGVELAKSSVSRIMHPESIPFSAMTLAILLLSIAVKLCMASFYRGAGEAIASLTLKAAAQDSRNDVLATGAVTVSILADHFLHIRLDGIVGLGVAVFILWSGFCLGRDTLQPLLGAEADEALVQEISQLVLSHKKVLGIHDLLIHDYGPGQRYASVHAEMDAGEDPLTAHDQLDHIEQETLRRLGVHLVIHFDPVVSDETWNGSRELARRAAEQLHSGCTIHDLRIVRYHGISTLAFDLAVPYDCPGDDSEIVARMEETLRRLGCLLPLEIIVDRTAGEQN